MTGWSLYQSSIEIRRSTHGHGSSQLGLDHPKYLSFDPTKTMREVRPYRHAGIRDVDRTFTGVDAICQCSNEQSQEQFRLLIPRL